MDLPELQERIDRWENLHTEFKEWPVRPDDLAACLVAFVNTDGGQLVLGVADDRRVVGIDDTDRVGRDVDNVARNNCEPPVTVVQEVITAPDAPERSLLVVNVPKGDQRPYRTNRGVHYVRTSTGRRRASREELLRLFQAAESLYYDETPLLRSRMQDLDLNAFERFLEYSRLSDAGLVTRAGSGVRRIVRLVREATGQDIEVKLRDYEVLPVIPRTGGRK